MNRLALAAIGLFLLALTACAPQAQVAANVTPTLVSATVDADTLVLQGRYFGDGQGGQAEASYVVLGADANGSGGIRAPVTSWTPSRIEVGVPEGTGYGYVFVYVDGIASTGLPVNLD